MQVRKFHMCTDDFKSLLEPTELYKAHLWCSYSGAKMKKLQVAFNDAFRIFLKFPRWACNVSTFHVEFNVQMQVSIYRFERCHHKSLNLACSRVCSTRCSSCFSISECILILFHIDMHLFCLQ